jgi:sugar phosphate isomerase/epimerase
VRLQHFAAEIVERILPTAERVGVKLGYELHVPLDLESERTHELLTQIRRLSSAHLGLIPDAGIFGRSVSKFRIAAGRAIGLTDEQVSQVVELWEQGASLDAAEELVAPFGAGQRAAEWAHGIWGSYGHSDPADLDEIFAHVIHVHGKFYSMENGDEPDLRYRDLVFALLDLGYEGWLSSEYEGPPADSFSMVAQHQDMIARYVREYRDLSSLGGGAIRVP